MWEPLVDYQQPLWNSWSSRGMHHLLPGPSSFHTETDLSVVPNDLTIAKCKGHLSNFVQLDLSAAINLTDHVLL